MTSRNKSYPERESHPEQTEKAHGTLAAVPALKLALVFLVMVLVFFSVRSSLAEDIAPDDSGTGYGRVARNELMGAPAGPAAVNATLVAAETVPSLVRKLGLADIWTTSPTQPAEREGPLQVERRYQAPAGLDLAGAAADSAARSNGWSLEAKLESLLGD